MVARTMNANADLESLKRQLIAHSDLHRQAVAAECQHLSDSLAWIPRSVELAKAAAPLLAVAVPVGWALLQRRRRRSKDEPPRPASGAEGRRLGLARTASLGDLLSQAWRGWQFFQQVWPAVQSFKGRRGNEAGD